MSYPDPVYFGDGEASGVLRPAGAAPELRSGATTAGHYLATGATTGGKFGLYRWDMLGPPTGPGPHFHRTMTESFFVLSGSVRLYAGDNWVDGAPGDFLHVPEGGVHGFRNESGEPASILILFAPGAPREAYFEGLAALANTGRTMTPEEAEDFYRRHDNVWL